MQSIDRTQELETQRIDKLLFKYALPAVVSQIIAAVCNIVVVSQKVCNFRQI